MLVDSVRSGDDGNHIPAINAVAHIAIWSRDDRVFNTTLDLPQAPLDSMAMIGGMEVRMMVMVEVERLGVYAPEIGTKAKAMGMFQASANNSRVEPEARHRTAEGAAQVQNSMKQRRLRISSESSRRRLLKNGSARVDTMPDIYDETCFHWLRFLTGSGGNVASCSQVPSHVVQRPRGAERCLAGWEDLATVLQSECLAREHATVVELRRNRLLLKDPRIVFLIGGFRDVRVAWQSKSQLAITAPTCKPKKMELRNWKNDVTAHCEVAAIPSVP